MTAKSGTDLLPWHDVGALMKDKTPFVFVIPGLMAGTIGVLVSAGGVGKSKLALGIAASIATGKDWWGLVGRSEYHQEPIIQGDVILISVEDSGKIIGKRLQLLENALPEGKDREYFTTELVKHLHILNVDRDRFSFGFLNRDNGISKDGTVNFERFVLSPKFRALSDYIDEREVPPRLVIIDTLNRSLNGISENDNSAMSTVITGIEDAITKSRAKPAVLILHHSSKSSVLGGLGDLQQASRGASALTDNARFQMNLTRMSEKEAKDLGVPDNRRGDFKRLSVSKNNYSPPIPDRWLLEDNGILRYCHIIKRSSNKTSKTPQRDS